MEEKTIELQGIKHSEFDYARNVMIVRCEKMLILNETPLSKELSSEQAHRMWSICKEEKWIDDNFQPLVSMQQAAILASVIADVLDLNPRWAPFEKLWNIPNLATKLSKAQGCKYYSTFIKAVEVAIF